MAYVARGVRQRQPDTTTEAAAEAAIAVMRKAFELEGERSPNSVQAVMKALQKLESGRESIPQYEHAAPLLEDAVDGAIEYLEKSSC